MTKTALNTSVSRVQNQKATSVAPSKKTEENSEKSTFETRGKNHWSTMTKSAETPSIIAEGLDMIEESTPPSRREQEQAYIGSFMCGDYGMIRTSDGANVLINDHEPIEVPKARDLFNQFSSLHNNTLPVLQRYVGLRTQITELIELTTQNMRSHGLNYLEYQGSADYLNYLYEKLHEVQNEIDLCDYMRLNEVNRRALEQEKADADAEALANDLLDDDNTYIGSAW